MYRFIKLPAFTLIALFAVFAISACGGSESQPATESQASSEPAPAPMAPASDETLIAEGKALYGGKAICFSCHGQEAEGTQLAPNLTDDTWLNIEGEVTKDKIIALIKAGVAQPKEHPAPMPPGGGASLNEDELNAVATYVLSLTM